MKKHCTVWFVSALAGISGLMGVPSANAGQFTVPWAVDLTLPANSLIPSFDAAYKAFDFSPPIGPDQMGLTLDTVSQHSYTLHLPFEISISAPDQVSPGQIVALQSSAVLAGTPSFSTAGSVSFNTSIFADSHSVPIGIPGITDVVAYNGVSLTVAGDRSYTSTDTSADSVLTRTIWKNDPFGAPLNMPVATQFEGYQLQTQGNLDAWGGSIDLLQFASNFIPGPVGAAALAVSAVVDVSVGPQLDIVDNTSLTTQFVTGYYTDDGGVTYDDFLINGATARAFLEIPDTLAAGDTYDIQMTALGLGFSTLVDYLLQGNVDIDLSVLSGLHTEDITEIPIGSEFLVDSWVDRFQYVEFLRDILNGADISFASLSFDVVGGLPDSDLAKFAPALPRAIDDTLVGSMIETNAGQGQQSFEFPGAPPSATASVAPVPEPSAVVLYAIGFLTTLARTRRRNRA